MADYQRYEASGEINFTVSDAAACVEAVLKSFGTRIHSIDHLDGVTVDLGNGSWFNLRTSNTEPLLRLNVEARSTEEVDEVVGQSAGQIERRSPQTPRRPHERRPDTTIDLDDVEGLLAADRNGLLRAASMAGAQVRATAAALDEGALDPLRADQPPRTVIWVAGRGTAETAGSMLAAALGGSVAAPIVVAPDAPPWIGALDVLVVAGDDPGDPALVSAAATAVRRGARVVVVAPYEGPLRDATAGRAVVLAPRLRVPDDFGLARYLAAGLRRCTWWIRACRWTWPRWPTNWTPRRCATAPAANSSPIPPRPWPTGCPGAGSCWPATTRRRWRWPATARRCCCGSPPGGGRGRSGRCARGAAQRDGCRSGADYESALFHDEEIDGPRPERVRTFVLSTDAERPVVVARVSGLDDVDVIGAEDVPDIPASTGDTGRLEQQLAMLAVRLEMTAIYLRLVRG